jgi:hypothetical protein
VRLYLHKNETGGMAQGEGPEFQAPVPQKKKKRKCSFKKYLNY